MRRDVLRVSVVAVLLAGVLRAPSALADTKLTCAAAAERAQTLRLEGKLTGAREQIAICIQPQCPAAIRADCAQWLNELSASQPSVVIGVRDAKGQDVFDVRVSVDGVVVAETLDGRPVPLDPGPHTFRFEQPGLAPIEERVLLRMGEQNRAVNAVLPAPPAASATPPPTPPRATASAPMNGDAETSARGARWVWPALTGAVAVAAAASAVYLDLRGTSDAHALRDSCAPSCAQGDISAVKTKYALAAVAGGVGAVALGATLYLVLRPAPGSVRTAIDALTTGARF